MDDIIRGIASKVRVRRRALSLTQQDLADLAGVSERFVRFVEQGKPSVRLDALSAVLGALGLELDVVARGASTGTLAARAATDRAGAGLREARP
ncbi:helix-turn-helix transcriptional regulator [Sinomonas sp. ASV322]|uniref:helix-turn-helix transcriptional regulator n=1 Tax=Sinomonas sp. ASV322 TaxID=3041920 RepID=UPI0027DAEA83|nr:helix-turn-helix transcriptional regulator [Sinomonas sp. ASV322]MDQ4502801.1 helix-turn-helix transcriptional regulator [Sinomonas sp. ASV322]